MIRDIVRRVVVGENMEGRTVIVRDDGVAAKRLAGIDLFPLWGIDAIPVKLPCSGLENAGSWAGEGVVRAAVGTIAAGVLVGKDDSAHLHFDEHGFHRTDSVDLAFIVSGEVTMRIPGEADVILRPGDTVVQNGATHAWENQGEQQAVILWLWGQRTAEQPTARARFMTLPAETPRDTLPGHGDEQGGLLTDGKRRAMLSILVLATALSSIDRQVLGLLLEPIRHEFKLSDTQLGILSGPTFTVLYATLALPMAVVSDRVSRRAVITFAVSMFSVMTVMCGFAPSFGFLVVFRMGVAVGEAGAVPASQALVADIYPKRQLTSAMSRLYLSQSVGGVLAFLLGGYLGQLLGWRLTWILVGAPGVLLAFAGYIILPRRNPTHIDTARPNARRELSPVRGTFAFLWSQPTYRYLTIGNAFWSFAGAGIGLWAGPLLSRAFGLCPMQIGIVLAVVVGLFGAAGLYFIGDFAERMGKRDSRWILWVVAASVLVAAPLGCLTFLSVSGRTALVSGGLLAFFAISTQGPIASAVQMIIPPSMRSVAVAVKHLIVTAVGAGSGPLAVGLINDALKHRFGEQAIRYSLSLATVGFLLAAVFFLAASRTFQKDTARAEAVCV